MELPPSLRQKISSAQIPPHQHVPVPAPRPWLVYLLIFFAGLMTASGFFLIVLPILRPSPPGLPASVPQIPADQGSPANGFPTVTKAPAVSHGLVYLRGANVYRYVLSAGPEEQVTTDGGALVQYHLPTWVDEHRVSFARCNYQTTDGKNPYTCILQVKDVKTGVVQDLVRLESAVNANGFHIGGSFFAQTWDHTGSRVAYLANPATAKANNENREVHILTVADKKDVLLDTFVPTGGRGGSLDDDISLHFSPDDSRLLLNHTSLYPATSGNDRGTMFVYDAKTNAVLWQKPNAWTTFGKWLDTNTIIAKQTSQSAGKTPATPRLIRITVSSGAVEELASGGSWHDLEPIGVNTVLFTSIATNPKGGVALERFDVVKKERSQVRPLVLKAGVVDENFVVVRVMKPCAAPDACEIDVFQGYLPKELAVLDMAAATVNALNIPESTPVIELDVH